MTVKELITKLLEYNLDAEVKLDLFNNFYEVEDFELGYGGPYCGEGLTAKDTPFVYIDKLTNSKENIS